jgi:hypothetical protein
MPFPSAPKNSVSLSTPLEISSKSQEDIKIEKQKNADKWKVAINQGMENASLLVFQALANTTDYGSSLEELLANQWYECVSEFEDSSLKKSSSPQLMRRYDFTRDFKINLLEGTEIPNPTKFNKDTGKIQEVPITLGMMLSWKDHQTGEFTHPGERLRNTMTNWLPQGKTVLIFPVRNKDTKKIIPYKFDIKIVDDGNLGHTSNKYDWNKYH